MRTVRRFALVGLLVSMLVLPASSAMAVPTAAGVPQADVGVAALAAAPGVGMPRGSKPPKVVPPRPDICKLPYNPYDLPSFPRECLTEEQKEAVRVEREFVNKCGPRNQHCLPKELYQRLLEREAWYDECGRDDEIKTSCMTSVQKAEQKVADTWTDACVYDRVGWFTGSDVHQKCQTEEYKEEKKTRENYEEVCLEATEGSGFEVDKCTGDPDLPCSPSNRHEGCTKEDLKSCPTEDKPGFWDVGTRALVALGCAFRTATVGIHTSAAAMWAKDRSTKPCGEVTGAEPCKVNPTSSFVWNVLFPFAVMVALGGIIWQGIILMITRRAEPLIDIFRGLITVSIWMSIGLAAPTIAMGAADEATWWVFDNFHEHKSTNWSVEVAAVRIPLDLISMLLALILAYIIGMIQYVIMIFREGTIIILSGTLVLAAAGNFTNATRQWLPKVLGWMVALILYKPIAALVVMSGAVMYNTGTESFDDWLMGVMFLFLSIIALPVLMKMFTWTSGNLSNTPGLQSATSAAQTYALYGKVR